MYHPVDECPMMSWGPASWKEARVCCQLSGPGPSTHLVQQEDVVSNQCLQLRNLALDPQQHMFHKKSHGVNAVPVSSVRDGCHSLGLDNSI